MKAEHFEILVEEPSMEAFLVQLLPKLVGDSSTFAIHVHQGKTDLLNKLQSRLRGYAKWLPETARIVVLVDRDEDDCGELKRQIEGEATTAGLSTRTSSGSRSWQVASRIAIEELEAWFFGNWSSARRAYPRLGASVINQAAYRHCDAIVGGTWEALERIFQRRGYFLGGLRKVELAQSIGEHFDPAVCISPSFIAFREAIVEAAMDP